MDLRRSILTFLLAAAAALPLPAQESSSWFRRTVNRLAAPPSRLDTAAVLRLRPRWNAAVVESLRRSGVSQTYSFDWKGTPVSLQSGLREGVYTGLGLVVGYGGLTVGFNRQIGRSAVLSKGNSLDFCGSGFGFQAAYYETRQPLRYTLTAGNTGDPDRIVTEGETGDPGRLRLIILEGVYALNRRDFSFGAVYKGNQVQRRSAGSWMLSAKYLQGEMMDSEEDGAAWLYLDLSRQAMSQAALGGGYSYNIVALHRQGAAGDEKSLRNLTFNLTAIPLLGMYDRHVVTYAFPNSVTGDTGPRTARFQSTLRPNFVVRAGVAFSWDRCFLNLTARLDGLSFGGSGKLVGLGGSVVDVKTAGRFNEWTTALKFRVRF